MHKFFLLVALSLLAALLMGCGTKSYMIRTNTGQEYVADGPPEYNVKSSTYTFIDTQGNEIVINKDDIRLIKEK